MTNGKLGRRDFLKAAGLGALGLSGAVRAAPGDALVYVSTYARGKSEGIHVYRMSLATGALTQTSLTRLAGDPNFLAIDPRRRCLYAVTAVGESRDRRTGGVTAFAIDPRSGALKLLNQQSAPGTPCYVSVHPSGRFVLIANYAGGNLAMYPIEPDGGLGAMSDVAQHTGRGANPERQDKPYAHCVMADAAGRYALATDLGVDQVFVYRLDTAAGKLVFNAAVRTAPAAGPRHVDFHPSGRFAYVINELNSTVAAYAYDGSRGTLSELQTISTLPAGFSGRNQCADIHVHPSGRFLYGSNRGHDSIAIFAIAVATGRLTLEGHQSTQGKWPRNFALDPAGEFLLAANQHTDSVVVFRIDRQSGRLRHAGHQVEVGAPACVKIIPAFS